MRADGIPAARVNSQIPVAEAANGQAIGQRPPLTLNPAASLVRPWQPPLPLTLPDSNWLSALRGKNNATYKALRFQRLLLKLSRKEGNVDALLARMVKLGLQLHADRKVPFALKMNLLDRFVDLHTEISGGYPALQEYDNGNPMMPLCDGLAQMHFYQATGVQFGRSWGWDVTYHGGPCPLDAFDSLHYERAHHYRNLGDRWGGRDRPRFHAHTVLVNGKEPDPWTIWMSPHRLNADEIKRLGRTSEPVPNPNDPVTTSSTPRPSDPTTPVRATRVHTFADGSTEVQAHVHSGPEAYTHRFIFCRGDEVKIHEHRFND